jgi:anti-sigma B factor antagonist
MTIKHWFNNTWSADRKVSPNRGDVKMEIIPQDCCTLVHYGASRLDAANASSFRKNMVKKVGKMAREGKPVILNLQHVNFIDDCGLGALLFVTYSLQGKTDMLLCGAGEYVKKMFKLTRVDRIFTTCEDIDAAKALARFRMQQQTENSTAIRAKGVSSSFLGSIKNIFTTTH